MDECEQFITKKKTLAISLLSLAFSYLCTYEKSSP